VRELSDDRVEQRCNASGLVLDLVENDVTRPAHAGYAHVLIPLTVAIAVGVGLPGITPTVTVAVVERLTMADGVERRVDTGPDLGRVNVDETECVIFD
jgi:hypothetical protein